MCHHLSQNRVTYSLMAISQLHQYALITSALFGCIMTADVELNQMAKQWKNQVCPFDHFQQNQRRFSSDWTLVCRSADPDKSVFNQLQIQLSLSDYLRWFVSTKLDPVGLSGVYLSYLSLLCPLCDKRLLINALVLGSQFFFCYNAS